MPVGVAVAEIDPVTLKDPVREADTLGLPEFVREMRGDRDTVPVTLGDLLLRGLADTEEDTEVEGETRAEGLTVGHCEELGVPVGHGSEVPDGSGVIVGTEVPVPIAVEVGVVVSVRDCGGDGEPLVEAQRELVTVPDTESVRVTAGELEAEAEGEVERVAEVVGVAALVGEAEPQGCGVPLTVGLIV